MTGYIKAFKPELKVKDYEIYKGIYCSLCKQLSKSYTPFAQLLLNYDLTFWLLIKLSLSSDCPQIAKKRCQYNPLVKCSCITANELLKVSADLIVIISYYKIKDNIRDEKAIKKILMLFLLPFISLMYVKAKRRSPEYEKAVATAMSEQRIVENNQETGIDRAAEPTAKAVSALFSIGEKDEHQHAIMERLGYLLGRWAYIVDAVDDLDDDIARKSFNPFKAYNPKSASVNQNEQFRLYAGEVLLTTSGEAVLAFELLETKRYREILENILYDGLSNTADVVLKKYARCDNEKPL